MKGDLLQAPRRHQEAFGEKSHERYPKILLLTLA